MIFLNILQIRYAKITALKIKHNLFTNSAYLKSIDYFLLAVAVLLSVFIRCRYINLPLERDEGEYAYAGMQLKQGNAAYENVYNMKFPGAYLFYALIFSLGNSLAYIRICFTVIHLLQLLLLYSITKNLFQDYRPAVYATIIYILLTSSFTSFGLLGKAEPIAILFFLSGLYILIRQNQSRTKNKWSHISAGILLGCCFLVKQNCLLFGLITIAWVLFYSENKLRSIILFAGGFLIPLIFLLTHLFIAGTFQNFKLFTIDYAKQYGGLVNFKHGWGIFRYEFDKLFIYNKIPLAIGAAGFLFILIAAFLKKVYRFLLVWVICSLIAFSAGYYFRPHYFLLVYPVFALAAGILLFKISLIKKYKVFALIPALTILVSIYFFIKAQTAFIFKDDAFTTMHKMYIWTPFPECIQIGNDIRNTTEENATIGMIGNEPEIAFYAERQLASGYLYLYPFFEDQKYALQMTKQFIAETEAKQPDIMIFSNVSWDATQNKTCEKIIEDWWALFRMNYELLESVCSDSDYGVKFFTNVQPTSYYTHWVSCIQVYKKIKPESIKPAN